MTDVGHDRGVLYYRRFLEGDETALRDIIEIYSDGLLYYINGFIGCLPYSEEVLSDTFLQLVVKKHNFKEEASFKTYLYAIARNKAFDFVRRMKRRRLVPLEQIESLSGDEALLCERIIREERAHEVHEAMAELNERYREVLYLSYFEELSVFGVGKVMGISRKQTENLLYRARLSLKEKLIARGFDGAF